jgi:polyisoprenoid-binding protein YceI
MRRWPLAVAAVWLALHVTAARAAETEFTLDPTHATVGFRAYALGLAPVDGAFAHFKGVLSIDPAQPTDCRVDVTVDVDSLQMNDRDIRDDVLAADMLDARDFQTLRYQGACQGGGIAGQLTMHGVTRTLFLAARRDGDRYSAQASLRRSEWGITGRPLLAGQTIRIRVSTVVPALAPLR